MAVADPQLRVRGSSRRLLPGLALAFLALCAGCARDDARWLADLEHPDLFVRGTAAIALCEQSPDKAVPAVQVLLEALEGPKVILREPARRALVRIGTSAADDLIGRLQSETDLKRATRKVLIDALATAGPEEIQKILAAMWNPGLSNAREIGLILARVGEPAVGSLVEALRAATEDKQRIPLVWVLGEIGPPAGAALSDLLAALQEGSPILRVYVLESVQKIRPTGEQVLPALRDALDSEQAMVRDAAVCAIARTQVARATLIPKDEWPGEIAAALRLGEPAWPALIESADHKDPAHASFARASLLALGAQIELAPKRRDLDPREAAGGVPSSEPVPGPAFPDLVHDRPAMRGAAALRLARLGRAALPALPLLLEKVADPHPGVVVCVQWAVWCIVLDACAANLPPASPRAR